MIMMARKSTDNLKTTPIFIVVCLFLICFACKTDNKEIQEEDTIYVYVGFTETEFPLLQESTILKKVFDNVINTNQYNHPYFMRQLSFRLSIREIDNNISISVELKKNKIIYCEKIEGIFFYRNHVFLYSGIANELLFSKTEKTYSFKCRDNDILMYDINDERYGVWKYHLYDSTIVKQRF